MPIALTIQDQSPAGQTINELTFDVLTETLTVRELIRSRVYQEVQDYNLRRPDVFRGLVQPDDAEEMLNGCKPTRTREIDWQQQFDSALRAFRTNRIVLLVDDRQVQSLDEDITITSTTRVVFLRLFPLVGG